MLVLGVAISPQLEWSIDWLRAAGYRVVIQQVNRLFQRGACELLRIQRDLQYLVDSRFDHR